jgi:hypothetical protein
MKTDVAWVALAPQSAVAGACELCEQQPVDILWSVIINHPSANAVRVAACDRCVLAVGRLAVLAGGQARFLIAPGARGAPAHHRGLEPRPERIHEYPDLVRHGDGTPYLVRVYGQPRSDGMWIGWLEFVAIGPPITRQTGRETTQSNRRGLVYWALGLQPRYLEGALARARAVEHEAELTTLFATSAR